MAGSTRLVDLVQARLDDFLAEQRSGPRGRSPPTSTSSIDARVELLAGGKRFRALFCYWGWQVGRRPRRRARSSSTTRRRTGGSTPSSRVAAALEIFHAAALVHDDIMDNSDTRRGQPSAAPPLRGAAPRARLVGSAAELRRRVRRCSSATCCSPGATSSSTTGSRSLRESRMPRRAARAEFTRMRTEVTVGQYLDILEETLVAQPARGRAARARPPRHRLQVGEVQRRGAARDRRLARRTASLAQLAALRDFGLPLGVAFQLRDDLLGVFGDPAVTGKPAGDDLREGKRTVLIALARAEAARRSASACSTSCSATPTSTSSRSRCCRTPFATAVPSSRSRRIIAHNVATAHGGARGRAARRARRATSSTALADTVTRRTS